VREKRYSFDAHGFVIYYSCATGVPVSSQQVRNLLAGRLGGPKAEARMKSLVADYLKVEGNRCAIMQNDDNLTNGVILQSKMQAAAFAKWPDVLCLDFTYNTNNIGFKMGKYHSCTTCAPYASHSHCTISAPLLTSVSKVLDKIVRHLKQ
jgi:hypothetical protein